MARNKPQCERIEPCQSYQAWPSMARWVDRSYPSQYECISVILSALQILLLIATIIKPLVHLNNVVQ